MGRSVVVPSPSWPYRLSPHAHTVPSVLVTKLWVCPPSTVTTSANPPTWAGVDWTLGPVPTCPSLLSPHPHTVPSGRPTSVWFAPADRGGAVLSTLPTTSRTVAVWAAPAESLTEAVMVWVPSLSWSA